MTSRSHPHWEYSHRPELQQLSRLPCLTFGLLWRYWPQLLVLSLIGVIADTVLTEIAVEIGFLNSLAGISMLAFVVFANLVIIVALFETVRPGLPTLDNASRVATTNPMGKQASYDSASFVSALALALVPFFAYYAAWGFLADTVRDYSKLSLDLMPFGEGRNLLEVQSGAWLILLVVIAWIVRRFAKFMHKRSESIVWPLVIVICEANWTFIGLFVLSKWKDEILAWAATLPETISHLLGKFEPISQAAAATPLPQPAEYFAITLSQQAAGLFWYALYPVVWMTLAALIYGYDINSPRPPLNGWISRAVSRWQSFPKPIRDFISHFISGTAKRYQALAEGVGLTLKSGLALILAVVIFYRTLDWGAAWSWYYIAHLIGPYDLPQWQLIAQGLSFFFGSPSAPGNGILVLPIKICLLAAALEIGLAGGRKWRRVDTRSI